MAPPDVSHTRLWVRDVVRSGLLPPDAVLAEVRAVIAEDHPELAAAETARAWVEEADREWRADARSWSRPTDHDLLQRAFAALEQRGIAVLQGCADHWAAKAVLDAGSSGPLRGIAWFTPSDVWHAIDEAMLEVNLWHADTANVAPGDALLADALEVFTECGLAAHFDEGRIEVAARWRRTPPATDE